jgi:periplasmic protein TonB
MKKIFLLFSVFICTNTFAQNGNDPAPQPPSVPKVVTVEDVIFQKVEVESEFIGGQKAWVKFLVQNLNSEVPLKNKAKKGLYTVIIRFQVNRDGSVTNIIIEKNAGYATGEEALRVLKLSPKWKPGFQNGVAVSSIKRQPITFSVE